jgi:integrase
MLPCSTVEQEEFMAATRTPGIIVLANGRRLIDKRYLGVRIGLRVGAVTQEQAEERLRTEMARVECDLARKAHARPTFTDCAARYIEQSRGKRSIDVIKWHVALLQSHIGDLEPQQVHDQTLEGFVKARLTDGASATTINRSLEVVRTILNRAARSYRDPDGRPWLDAMPPLITMLPENPRSPYPITWQEQDALFRRLPAHLARMALFAINTGLRDSNVCGLQWQWEVAVPEVGRSVFVIPPEAFKTKRPHVAILNDVAWSIIESQRGKHPIWVFPYRGRRIGKMNNNGWQQARYEAGLTQVRVHDLRHSFACRLRAAGVSAEDREALLGHANHSMAGHYASADVGHLLKQANLIVNRSGTQTVLRVADRHSRQVAGVQQRRGGPGFAPQVHESQRAGGDRWITRSTAVPQQGGRLGFGCQVFEIWRARQDLNPRPPGS